LTLEAKSINTSDIQQSKKTNLCLQKQNFVNLNYYWKVNIFWREKRFVTKKKRMNG